MPYIHKDDRAHYEDAINLICTRLDQREWCMGDMNYVFTMILKRATRGKVRCYMTLNELMGMVECVKQEFYRRDVVEYETEKIKQHGDIE